MRDRITLAALGVVALLVFAPQAMGQATEPTVALDKTGTTKLSLSKAAKAVLNKAGVRVTGRTHRIIAGAIDPSDFQPAEIDHKGRIVFKAGQDKVIFRKLTLLRGPQNRLTGQTGGETVTIARVTGGTVARQGLDSTDLNGAKGRLTRAAARLLNRALDADGRFKRGLLLGRLSTDTHYSEVLIDAAGETALQIDPAVAQKLASAGISATPVAPATATAGPSGLPLFHFPISGGRLNPTTGFGSVEHAGGLQLSNGSTTIVLDTPFVELAAASRLTVSLGGARTSPADVDMSAATKTFRSNGVDIAGAVAKLNATGAAALNTLFNTTVFAAGDVVGTATSNITFK